LNFENVFEVVAGFLKKKDRRYAVIGGVALVAYGLPRTTLDLDFIVESAAQDDLIRFLESRGYETRHRSSGYSNHRHSDYDDWGNLDFVYIGNETSAALFPACRIVTGPGGIQMPVPKPEHLAALKVQAIKNDPARALQDLADIRYLLHLPGVDRLQIKDYFDRQGLGGRFDEVDQS
jgi:hypothetical protein